SSGLIPSSSSLSCRMYNNGQSHCPFVHCMNVTKASIKSRHLALSLNFSGALIMSCVTSSVEV
ncbi:MAG: hypothetical protein ACK53Y_08810, partial [bacterium]